MKNGEKNIAIEIKKFDVEIGRYLFEVNKDNKQPSPLQGRIIKYLSKHEGKFNQPCVIDQGKNDYQKSG